MFEIHIDGARVLTSNTVADALLAHIRALNQLHETDVVDFPGLAGGRPTLATACVGAGVPFAALELSDDLTLGTIDGDDLAAWVLRQRTAELEPRAS